MAVAGGRDTLRIRVLEDSAVSAVFVVRVCCRDPSLVGFWQGKALFSNGQVEQAAAPRMAEDGTLEFVLRALRRSPRLSNAHYWSPFTVALCLDAMFFHYRLAPRRSWIGDGQDDVREDTLVLVR